MEVTGGGTVLTHRTKGAAAALGGPVMRSGQHSLAFLIAAARGDEGFGIGLGLVDADAPFSPRAGGPAWVFSPYTGQLHATRDVYVEGEPCRALMAGHLRGRAVGAIVELHIDMDAKT
eukprot:1353571-Prymnesium_polylepis.1